MQLTELIDDLAAQPGQQLRFIGLDGKLLVRTFGQLHADVLELMAELRSSGLAEGDLVGLLAANCYDWMVADLALLGLRCVSVALPVEAAAGGAAPVDAGELLQRYELSALLVGRTVRLAGADPAVAVLGERPVRLTPRAVRHDRVLDPDVFTVAFSSGTAGIRKGLLLTRAGIVNTIETSAAAWRIGPDDDILIVMPFSSFQQRYLFYTAIRYGCRASVVAPERMFGKLKALEPTIVLGPPSFFEIVDTRIRAAGRRDRLPYYAAAALHALAPGLSRGLRARLGRRWLSMYGSRIRLMLTGSAPVSPRLVTVFHQLGAPLYEVYGSTEVGWIAFNLPGHNRIGTAGRPVEGVTVTLTDDDGEVVVRSRQPQSIGYVFDGVETEPSVFLPGGRIATGDLGRWDHGHLALVGRNKNVLITRSGVKISPEQLERDIERSCAVTKAVVVTAGGASTLSCAIWLDDWQDARRTGEIEAHIERANAKRPASHRIVRVVFRPAGELSPESGLLTRNLKVDREAVLRTVFPADAEAVR